LRKQLFLFTITLVFLFSFQLKSEQLSGIPETKTVLGNDFVEAWTAFRGDIDLLFAADIHPEVFDEWINKMPEFLLRDVVRLASEHEIILAAINRLATLGGKSNQRFIKEFQKSYTGKRLKRHLMASLIKAGDSDAIKNAINDLNSLVRQRSINAAIILSEAGDKRGYRFLKALIKKDNNDADIAVLALGRYGALSDINFLKKQQKLKPENEAINIAIGEMEIRKYFPKHYKFILAKSRSNNTTISLKGLYETWFKTSEHAIAIGAITSEQFVKVVNKMRHNPPSKWDEDLFKRQLSVFYDLWINVDEKLKHPTKSKWPTNYRVAMKTIIATKNNVELISSRVAASISICSEIGKKINYPKLAIPKSDLKILSPSGMRAADGNMTTSLHLSKNDSFILEHLANRYIKSLWFMISCPDLAKSSSVSIEISGKDRGSNWNIDTKLDGKSRYFQEVKVNKRSNKRLIIKVIKTSSRSPVCISELRAQFKK